MPDIIVTPSDTQDVLAKIKPVNAAGEPVTGPFTWSSSQGNIAAAQPADDGLSCLFVCAPGVDLDIVCNVVDPKNGFTASFRIQRTAPPPPDNLTADFGLTAELVDKVATPPTP